MGHGFGQNCDSTPLLGIAKAAERRDSSPRPPSRVTGPAGAPEVAQERTVTGVDWHGMFDKGTLLGLPEPPAVGEAWSDRGLRALVREGGRRRGGRVRGHPRGDGAVRAGAGRAAREGWLRLVPGRCANWSALRCRRRSSLSSGGGRSSACTLDVDTLRDDSVNERVALVSSSELREASLLGSMCQLPADCRSRSCRQLRERCH